MHLHQREAREDRRRQDHCSGQRPAELLVLAHGRARTRSTRASVSRMRRRRTTRAPSSRARTRSSRPFPSGWSLTSAVCSDGSAANAIALDAGETVTCTFTNTKHSKIVVEKQTNPDGDTQVFGFNASYDANGFSLSDGQQDDSGPLAPGTYSVSENVPCRVGPEVGRLLRSVAGERDRSRSGRDGHLRLHEREGRVDHRREADRSRRARAGLLLQRELRRQRLLAL